MTDKIKAGDRFEIPDVEVAEFLSDAEFVKVKFGHCTFNILASYLATCQRLPPRIGVGDKVRFPVGGGDFGAIYDAHDVGVVEHISGDKAWVICNLTDTLVGLSNLTLVKKAERAT